MQWKTVHWRNQVSQLKNCRRKSLMMLWDCIMKWHNEIQHMSEMVHRHRRKIKKSWLSLQWQTKEQYLRFRPDICMKVSAQCWVIIKKAPNQVLGIIQKINGGFYSIIDTAWMFISWILCSVLVFLSLFKAIQ